jgi:hypothetical protein
MQQLANRDPYYNILAPQVAGNLTTDEYKSLFQAYKVIYPDYASRHFVEEIKTLVIDIMAQRGSTFLRSTDFYLIVDTDQGTQILDHPQHSILDILNWYYPTWQTHQHLDAFTTRSSPALSVAPHPDTSDTGLVVRIQSIPRGHPASVLLAYSGNNTMIIRTLLLRRQCHGKDVYQGLMFIL